MTQLVNGRVGPEPGSLWTLTPVHLRLLSVVTQVLPGKSQLSLSDSGSHHRKSRAAGRTWASSALSASAQNGPPHASNLPLTSSDSADPSSGVPPGQKTRRALTLQTWGHTCRTALPPSPVAPLLPGPSQKERTQKRLVHHGERAESPIRNREAFLPFFNQKQF